MNRFVTIILAAALTTISGWGNAQQTAGVQTLRGADAAEADKAPVEKIYPGKKPGMQKAIARTFKGQPPLVPHATDNFDEITVTENQCVDCHGLANYVAKKSPKLVASHLVVGSDGKKELSMERYQCNSCHVAQVDAKPLVVNTFVGNVAVKK